MNDDIPANNPVVEEVAPPIPPSPLDSPAVPQPKTQRNIITVVLLVTLTVLAVASSLLLLNAKRSEAPAVPQNAAEQPLLNTAPVATPALPSGISGSISGTVCYPSEYYPRGEIVAINIYTGRTFNQPFPAGSLDGKFQIHLNPDTYYLRYQAHASENNPEVFSSAYLVDETKHLQAVTVRPDQDMSGVSLCYFGSGPEEEVALDEGFFTFKNDTLGYSFVLPAMLEVQTEDNVNVNVGEIFSIQGSGRTIDDLLAENGGKGQFTSVTLSGQPAYLRHTESDVSNQDIYIVERDPQNIVIFAQPDSSSSRKILDSLRWQ